MTTATDPRGITVVITAFILFSAMDLSWTQRFEKQVICLDLKAPDAQE
jgi:hypothetical protein